jgi:hypothetical protein
MGSFRSDAALLEGRGPTIANRVEHDAPIPDTFFERPIKDVAAQPGAELTTKRLAARMEGVAPRKTPPTMGGVSDALAGRMVSAAQNGGSFTCSRAERSPVRASALSSRARGACSKGEPGYAMPFPVSPAVSRSGSARGADRGTINDFERPNGRSVTGSTPKGAETRKFWPDFDDSA